MRVAVFSDVHGNVAALEAVLAQIGRRGPFDRILNGGDCAFGGPRPREAMERLIAAGHPAVIGNTDEWVSEDPDGAGGPIADWARTRLTAAQRSWLRGLPRSQRVESPGDPPLVLVHATPWSTTDLIAPDAPEGTITRAFDQAHTRALVYGHIHIAYVREIAGGLIVNTGSTGLPFDGDPRSAWAIFDLRQGAWHAEIVRTEYDREAAARDLLASDHPDAAAFARRIRSGRR